MSKTVIPLGDEIVQELADGSNGTYTITAPIDKLDQSAYLDNVNMRGQRIYSPTNVTGFEKGWYEVVEDTSTDAPHVNKWEKVVEGSSVDIDGQTIIKDDTTDELKVNLDNDTLWCPMENIKVKYNNDTLTTNSDGLQLTGVLPTLVADTNIQFGKTSDGKWGYKVGADSVVPFSKEFTYIIEPLRAGDYSMLTCTYASWTYIVITQNCTLKIDNSKSFSEDDINVYDVYGTLVDDVVPKGQSKTFTINVPSSRGFVELNVVDNKHWTEPSNAHQVCFEVSVTNPTSGCVGSMSSVGYKNVRTPLL